MKPRYNRRAVGLALKAAAKSAIWGAFNRHESGAAPDLWLFGSRRSGSTLLMQMIGVNPGIKFCNQPLSVRSAGPMDLQLLQCFEEGALIGLIPETAEEILDYIQAIRAGELHHNEPWRLWSPDFHWRSDRIVFKVTSGSGIASWICASLPAQPVVLVRHPIAQSLSCMRNRWHPRSQVYLQSDQFRAAYVKPSQVDDCLRIQREGSPLERHVLTWCCENVSLMKLLKDYPSCSFIPYEDLVLHKAAIIEEMSGAFALPATAAMGRSANVPSISSGLSSAATNTAIKNGEVDILVAGWREHVSEAEEREAMALLGWFDLSLYQAGDAGCRVTRRIQSHRPKG